MTKKKKNADGNFRYKNKNISKQRNEKKIKLGTKSQQGFQHTKSILKNAD